MPNDSASNAYRRRTTLAVSVLVCLAMLQVLAGAVPMPFCSGSWCTYTPYAWEHDGAPYESEHFTIYSDMASESLRRVVADTSEESLDEIVRALGIDPVADFDLPLGRDTIDVFVDVSRSVGWGGWAYYGGFLVSSRVCGQSSCHKATIKHELMHVVAYLLEGYRSTSVMLSDTWFDEGLAEYVSGARTIEKAYSLRYYSSRIAAELEDGNPIRVRTWSDFTPSNPAHYGGGIYPLFELAFRYLVDEDGLGQSLEDARDVFLDIRSGLTFDEAFEHRFGLSVAEYEATFLDRMEAYLD